MPDFQLFPLPFWLVLLALAFFAVRSWQEPESALRVPMLMVLFTVAVWYVGDVLYNDYAGYRMEIDETSLDHAWWEVLEFVCAFAMLAPLIHRAINRRYLGKPSNLLSLIYHGGVKSKRIQGQVDALCGLLFVAWVAMMIVGLIRTDFDFQGMFLPYLGEKADPWARGRLGAGYDSLLAAAGFLQIGLTAAFGVIAALAYRPLTLVTALLVWFLTLPGYIFDRTRSVILATVLPGFLAWVFLRLRGGILVKVAILALGFLAVDGWLKFVIENRGNGSIAATFSQGTGLAADEIENSKHLGLNMFEELAFVNLYIANGSYHPNWGARYFAELVNPIPRGLWPGKPMIGIDYAIARGQKTDTVTDDATGVSATISTGMIGQGIVNFGRILGPLGAAALMALWAAILARQDLLAAETGRLFLYAIGLVLTFNMGRDITLLVLYPFGFGYLLLRVVKGWQSMQAARAVSRTKSRAESTPAANAPVAQRGRG
jgi:hypothetical protein